ncbi:MAG: OsmC family peroxiredoxin [Chryseobacterium sp.]|nr:MAG: OsmC family peroxiredoxin [Chryseobacterium sp.]
MKVTLNRINGEYLFECANKNGQKILLDNTTHIDAKGVSPMESLLMAVAGCSGIDIISILKKQRQELTVFSAEVEGERVEEDDAKPFKKIKVTYFLEGNIDFGKAARAAQLSFDKYCSVSKTLQPKVEFEYEVIVNGMRAKADE